MLKAQRSKHGTGGGRRSSMPSYRQADISDVPDMARIRASEWGSEDYWRKRIAGYMRCELHPQQALMTRVAYVAEEGQAVIGFIAGHLTHRFGCAGELEWINVLPERRGSGISSALLRLLAAWFIDQHALRICVDVDPANTRARRFYLRYGAQHLNPRWLIWNDIGKAVLSRAMSC